MAEAFAPGKCILFGEHAVVLGHPAVAVAIDQGVTVNITESNKWILDGQEFSPEKHPHISHTINELFNYQGRPLNINISSDLFSAAGLGSSAALSNAFGAALYHHMKQGTDIDRIRLAKYAHSAEANAQKGRASPTDTATSSLGGCVVVSGSHVLGTKHIFDTKLLTPEGQREWSINIVELPLSIRESWLVLGFTGEGAPTGKMVEKVAKLLKEKPEKIIEMDAIANITKAGLTALSVGNLEALGIAMNACHERLRSLEVSTLELDDLVSVSRPHSYGAKLTGAGGGGCMVALTKNPSRVAEAIEVAGGKPLISSLGSDGVRIIKN